MKRMHLRKTALAASAAAALATLAAPASAATFAKSVEITVAGLDEGVALPDFPLLVRLSASTINGFSYDAFQTEDHTDLRFEDEEANALPYDVDTWDANGESLVWVKVPSVSKGTKIKMLWGSPETAENTPTDVWSNYVFVWHGNGLSEDATGRMRTESPNANGFAVNATGGILGSGLVNSTAAYKYVKVSTNPFADLSSVSRFAVSGWFSPKQSSPLIRLFSTKHDHPEDGMELLAVSSGGLGMVLRGKSNSPQVSWADGYQNLKNKGWAHVAARINGTAAAVFSNGASTSGSVNAPTTAGVGFAILGYGDGTGYNNSLTDGAFDEIRLYDGVPSDDYLKAEYAQVVTSGWLSFGAVEDAVQGAPEMENAPSVVRNGDGTYTISATFSGSAGVAYSVSFRLNGNETASQSVTIPADAENATATWTTGAALAEGTYLASVSVALGESAVRKSAASSFLVGNVGFGAGTDASEEGLIAGAFVLTRPDDANGNALTVAYTVASANAVAGRTYEAFSGVATFAAGEATVAVPVVPKNDALLTEDATLTLTLAPGLYGIADGAASASVKIVNWATPEGYNVWIAQSGSDGLASTASNWSAGRAPVAADKVLFGAWSVENVTWDADATHTVASWTQMAQYTGHVEFPITYAGCDVDEGFNLLTVSGDVSLSGGFWQHPVQGVVQGADSVNSRYRIAVSVGGDFTIGSDVTVSGQARGRFAYHAGWAGLAMHGGLAISSNAYAKEECQKPDYPPFGSILEPTLPGRGASSSSENDSAKRGHGGGAVWFDVKGDFTNNGRITVNGDNSRMAGGGSGGSIYVHAANISFGSSATAEANGFSGTKTDGPSVAGSGGRIALVADGALDVDVTKIECAGSRAGDKDHTSHDYYTAAAGTEWLASPSESQLVVRNASVSFTLGAYDYAYTPIPADDDAAAFKAAIADATLYAASHARVRLAGNLRFKALKVRDVNGSRARVDLYGRRLQVESVTDNYGNELASRGTYTLADALANGWAWFEDSSATLSEDGASVATAGTGVLVVGRPGFTITIR